MRDTILFDGSDPVLCNAHLREFCIENILVNGWTVHVSANSCARSAQLCKIRRGKQVTCTAIIALVTLTVNKIASHWQSLILS